MTIRDRAAPSCGSQESYNLPNYQPYQYGSVALKRDAYARDAYAPVAPRRQPKRRVDVVPGGAKGRAQQTSPAHAFALKFAKATIVAVIVFAVVGFGRISLSAATVAEALQAREVTNQLEDSRSSINQLEVTQSTLSNPTRIKNEAAALGMTTAAETIVLDLSGDVVATDADGNLSLSGSLDVLAEGATA